MERINTPTRIPDLYGPGKDGFGGVPPNRTELSTSWFNNVQETLARAVEGQGIVLDGSNLDQLTEAINDWAFSNPSVTGNISIANGGTLTIEGGATMEVESTGIINVQNGAGLVLQMGSTFAVESGVTLTADDNTWVWGSSNANDWTINGNVQAGTDGSSAVSLIGDVTIGFDAASNATLNGAITGAVGSSISAPVISPLSLSFQSSGTTLPGNAGEARWNDTFFSVRDGAGQIRTLSEPSRGFDLTFSTTAASTDTTAETGRRIKQNEDVWIDIGTRVSVDAASQDVAYQVRVTGPLGFADIFTSGIRTPTVANTGACISDGLKWKPTDTWPAEAATQNYTFRVRMGVSGGGANTVTADRIRLTVESAVQV